VRPTSVVEMSAWHLLNGSCCQPHIGRDAELMLAVRHAVRGRIHCYNHYRGDYVQTMSLEEMPRITAGGVSPHLWRLGPHRLPAAEQAAARCTIAPGAVCEHTAASRFSRVEGRVFATLEIPAPADFDELMGVRFQTTHRGHYVSLMRRPAECLTLTAGARGWRPGCFAAPRRGAQGRAIHPAR